MDNRHAAKCPHCHEDLTGTQLAEMTFELSGQEIGAFQNRMLVEQLESEVALKANQLLMLKRQLGLIK